MTIDRRTFVAAGALGALAPARVLAHGPAGAVTPALADYVARYMAARNAPGMILALADREGWSETAAYGVAELDGRRPIRPDERFHIGSISKSFAALMILQLAEEGRLSLDADITRYLPDLRLKTPFAPVTVHHLLCHASGLQDESPPLGAPPQALEQFSAPGTHFHYSNMGYAWLGRIVVARGGEPWPQALRRRILDPLGMTETATLIGAGMRRVEVPSYIRLEDDRPFPRQGPLSRAGPLDFTDASGCIASTARDMTRYVAMIARRGEGPHGRLLSAEGFALMTKRHIAAAEFGPHGGYGYGWMTDQLDGRPVIRHTGGMPSFMSSIHVDPAAGVGAFASINAQQNYRPVPVTGEALRLLRARAAGGPPPRLRDPDPDADLDLGDYVGDYAGEGGTAHVRAAGRMLAVTIDGAALTLESLGDDNFVCLDPRWRLFTFAFRRATPPLKAAADRPNPVVAFGWGRRGFLRRGAHAPALPVTDTASVPAAALADYEGLYVADGGWLPCVRIVARDGRLWVDGPDLVAPLAGLGDDRFRFADETASPELAIFSATSTGPRTLQIAGAALARVGHPFAELA